MDKITESCNALVVPDDSVYDRAPLLKSDVSGRSTLKIKVVTVSPKQRIPLSALYPAAGCSADRALTGGIWNFRRDNEKEI